ncbi:MAG: hypothetical protein C5B49_15995 [Bdellovibrio sp.]|nr:MAG: hypothetical protein C5B49_15995 [Bdellovibrio sp.]
MRKFSFQSVSPRSVMKALAVLGIYLTFSFFSHSKGVDTSRLSMDGPEIDLAPKPHATQF